MTSGSGALARRRQHAVTRLFERIARVAFTFIVMNASAVAGAFAALMGRRVWRR